MITREQAIEAMTANYDKAREELLKARPELFGKLLDNKARKLALKLAGIELPEGCTVAWATPHGWAHGSAGYRGTSTNEMATDE